MSLQYNGLGYLSKDDIIKSMAHDIERLEKELHECRHMKTTYRGDVLEILADNARLRNELHKQAQMMYGPFAAWNAAKEGKPQP
jgi:ribosome-interacting GTPase 1